MEMDNKKLVPAAITAICGLLVIIAFFVAWMKSNGITETGLEFLQDAGKEGFKDLGIVCYAPLIAMIFAILAIVFAVINVVGAIELPKMTYDIAYIVGGLVIIIFVVVFMTYTHEYDYGIGKVTFKMMDNLDVGVWLSLVGGILMALNGVLGITNVYEKILQ